MNFHKIFNPANVQSYLADRNSPSSNVQNSDPLTLKQLWQIIAKTPVITMKNEIVRLPEDVVSLRDLSHLYQNRVYHKQIQSSHHIKPELLDYRKPNELSIYTKSM